MLRKTRQQRVSKPSYPTPVNGGSINSKHWPGVSAHSWGLRQSLKSRSCQAIAGEANGTAGDRPASNPGKAQLRVVIAEG